jgi:integrase
MIPMSGPFKRRVTTYTLPDGKHRTPDGRRVTKETVGAVPRTTETPLYYGHVTGADGLRRLLPLCADKTASRQMLAKLQTDAKLASVGLAGQFAEQLKRPLAEHLADWQADLTASGATAKHVRQTAACVRRVLTGCRFVFIPDLSASAVQRFLAELRDRRPALPPLDVAKGEYAKREAAAVAGVKVSAVTALVRRHRLAATGQGKARRYPRATVETLRSLRGRGRSIKTSNLYLDAVKQFAAWLVQDRRTAESPLDHLAGGNVKLDRRHDRQTLTAEQLRSIVQAARESGQAFRGLTGPDRALLYTAACATGFRAEELSSLYPVAFDFDAEPPTVTLAAEHAKNGRTAVQPLPPDVVEAMRGYLAARPSNQPLWPGTWFKKAADMLRIDLDDAGIPYVVEGPDGPRYADFHALRHSFIGLLDKSGATLKEAMQLARHSDPKLTMAVYGRAQLHDLGRAIRRLPNLTDGPQKQELAATGTTGGGAPSPRLHHFGENPCVSVRADEKTTAGERAASPPLNVLPVKGIESECESVKGSETSSPTRTRTWNKPVNSRLLYH